MAEHEDRERLRRRLPDQVVTAKAAAPDASPLRRSLGVLRRLLTAAPILAFTYAVIRSSIVLIKDPSVGLFARYLFFVGLLSFLLWLILGTFAYLRLLDEPWLARWVNAPLKAAKTKILRRRNGHGMS